MKKISKKEQIEILRSELNSCNEKILVLEGKQRMAQTLVDSCSMMFHDGEKENKIFREKMLSIYNASFLCRLKWLFVGVRSKGD